MINLDDLHKIESSTVIPLANQTEGTIKAIIKVKEPGYVPKNVQIRASISPILFTAEFEASDLKLIETDVKVESISINKRI